MSSVYQPAGTLDGLATLRSMTGVALDILEQSVRERGGPVVPGGPAAARTDAAKALAAPLLPERGGEATEVLADLVREFAHWSVDLAHPYALARMQCPPTAVAAAAELVTTVLNQSLHAWESGPFALELERWVVAELAKLVGLPDGAGGTMTVGGSVSNLMAMVLARDSAIRDRSVLFDGIVGLRSRPVVLAPAGGLHFSFARAARIMGLGESAVLEVAVDDQGRMRPDAADELLSSLGDDTVPVALLACAGSTDLGVIDPLDELADVAAEHGVWFHADAAYGAGALFSDRLRPMLGGIERADSVTLDLHKFAWCPASAAVLLVSDPVHLPASFGLSETTCLSSSDDTCAGYLGSQNSSIQTTRRSDALKVAVTLRTLGRERMGAMADACHELARHAAARIDAEPKLELPAWPPMSALLFRYLPSGDTDPNEFNGALRRAIMDSGLALVARTHLAGNVYLKLIMLNPDTRPQELDVLVDAVLTLAETLETS